MGILPLLRRIMCLLVVSSQTNSRNAFVAASWDVDLGPLARGTLYDLEIFSLLPTYTSASSLERLNSKDNIDPGIYQAIIDAKDLFAIKIRYNHGSIRDEVGNVVYNLNEFPNCDTDETKMSAVIGQLAHALSEPSRRLRVIIPPPCRVEFEAIGQLTDYLHVPLVTGGGELISTVAGLSNTFRLSFNARQIWEAFVALCEEFSWNNIVIVYDDEPVDLPDSIAKYVYASELMDSVRSSSVNRTASLVRHYAGNDISSTLEAISISARIVVIVASRLVVRRYMLVAYDRGMCKGEYAFFTLDIFNDPVMADGFGWKAGDADDNKAKLAYQALLVVAIRDYTQSKKYKKVAEEIKKNIENEYAMLRRDINYRGSKIYNGSAMNYYTASYYDAIMLFASRIHSAKRQQPFPPLPVVGLDRALNNLPNKNWRKQIVDFAREKTVKNAPFEGISGSLHFDEHGNRHQDLSILDMQDIEQGMFVVVRNFSCAEDVFEEPMIDIKWPHHAGAPKDPPECGYTGNLGPCQPLGLQEKILIGTCAPGGALFIVMAAYLRYRYVQRKRRARDWIVVYDMIQFPADVQDWLRRRYTLIDDSAGGLAIPEVIKIARDSVAAHKKLKQTTHHVPGQIIAPGKLTLLRKHSHLAKTQGVYRDSPATIRMCEKNVVRITRQVIKEVHTVRSIRSNENVIKFVGASVEWKQVAILYEFCAKGTLQDLLAGTQIKLDWIMRLSITSDILRGLAHIHATTIECHGRLTSKCCHVDSRFIIKLADYGLPSFFTFTTDETNELKENGKLWDMLLWTAPEHIGETLGEGMFSTKLVDQGAETPEQPVARKKGLKSFLPKTTTKRKQGTDRESLALTLAPVRIGSKQGDIFSFAIILSEIIHVAKPYHMYHPMTNKEIVLRVRDRLSSTIPFRPIVLEEECGHKDLHELLLRCWSHQYNQRPGISSVRAKIKDIGEELGLTGKMSSIMDIMFNQMEELAINLQVTIEEKTRIIQEEKTRSFELYAKVLPRVTAERLRNDERIAPELYDIVTVLMCDVVHFADLIANCSPAQIINFTTDLHNYYESIVKEFDCVTIDFYQNMILVASGLPVRNGIFNAREIARLALTLLFKTIQFKVRHSNNGVLLLRMAIHTGPVVAGLVGESSPKYCVFGETIFVCHRMVTFTEAGVIRCSSAAHNIIETFGSFVLNRMDEMFLKGKGMQTTYNLCGENANISMQRLETNFRVVFPNEAELTLESL